MIIDENKQYGLFKLEKSRKIYSDLSVILLKLYLRTVTEKQKKNRIITKYGFKKYKTNWHIKKDTTQERSEGKKRGSTN